MTEATYYGRRNFMHQGKKPLQNRYQNPFFREQIKPFKRVTIVEIIYSVPKLQS